MKKGTFIDEVFVLNIAVKINLLEQKLNGVSLKGSVIKRWSFGLMIKVLALCLSLSTPYSELNERTMKTPINTRKAYHR